MPLSEIIHERIRFGKDEYLAGLLGYPAQRCPRRSVLLCSPHPNFGGDMQNNVVGALAEHFSADAITLRFDYRGVGQSYIDLPPGISVFDYWENVEKTLDYLGPLADTSAAADALSSLTADLPMIAIGYSFGAVMATRIGMQDARIVAMAAVAAPLKRVQFQHLADCHKACLFVSGQDDFVYDADVATKLVESSGRNLLIERAVADHFFIGVEAELADRIARFVHQPGAHAEAKADNAAQ
jgi:alpha/beta superfamily hydrolase